MHCTRKGSRAQKAAAYSCRCYCPIPAPAGDCNRHIADIQVRHRANEIAAGNIVPVDHVIGRQAVGRIIARRRENHAREASKPAASGKERGGISISSWLPARNAAGHRDWIAAYLHFAVGADIRRAGDGGGIEGDIYRRPAAGAHALHPESADARKGYWERSGSGSSR